MKGAVLGAKESPSPKIDHAVVPPVGLPCSSVQSKAAPPQACTSMPRWFLYQDCKALGSLALKKTPPMPVTRFITLFPLGRLPQFALVSLGVHHPAEFSELGVLYNFVEHLTAFFAQRFEQTLKIR